MGSSEAVSSSGGAPVSAGSEDPGSVSPSTDSGGSCAIESSIEAAAHFSRYSKSGLPEKVTSWVIGYEVKPPSLIRSASSTKASRFLTGMSVTMLFSVAVTRPGIERARVVGSASSATARTIRCWRHMRLKSSEPSRDRAYHSAWKPSSFCSPGSM